MPTALITGITGQDGSYLAELLLSKGYRVVGVAAVKYCNQRAYQSPLDDITLFRATETRVRFGLLEEYQPKGLQPCCAIVRTYFMEPTCSDRRYYIGVTRILEAIRFVNPKIRFYQASSSEMFGKVLEVPQKEDTPFYPRSPYGVAKVYGHWITVNYRESFDMFATSGILFNHESPRRGLEFVTRKITDGVAKIKLGLAKDLHLGNLESQRDWGFAGDYVEAMWRMLQQEPDSYVTAWVRPFRARVL
jgi:GDPmannose 4,6-dehydratase